MKMIKNKLLVAFFAFCCVSNIQSMEPEKPSSFSDLPLEIDWHIVELMYLNSASIQEAGKSINALAQTTKEWDAFLNDPVFCLKIIKKLAKKFSSSDEYAAYVLQTSEAKMRFNVQRQFFSVCNQEYFNENDFKLLYDKYGTYVDLYFTYYVINVQGKRVAANLLMLAAEKSDCTLIRTLFSYGVNVNIGNKSGLTALMIAARKGNVEVIQCLLDNTGIVINQRTLEGFNALMYAVRGQKNNCPIIQMLLKYGADINQADDDGMTPLMFAVEEDKVDVVKCLLEYPHIEINKEDNNERTALQMAEEIAEETGNQEIVNLIIRALEKK